MSKLNRVDQLIVDGREDEIGQLDCCGVYALWFFSDYEFEDMFEVCRRELGQKKSWDGSMRIWELGDVFRSVLNASLEVDWAETLNYRGRRVSYLCRKGHKILDAPVIVSTGPHVFVWDGHVLHDQSGTYEPRDFWKKNARVETIYKVKEG